MSTSSRKGGESVLFQLHRRIPLVRRPFFQKDQALRERDAALSERNAAIAERDAALADRAASRASVDMKFRYIHHVSTVRGRLPLEEAMSEAVGGHHARAIGKIELALLRHYGLKHTDYLIDVGCGPGRLALPLSFNHGDRYLGTDLVPDLLDYARRVTKRPTWRFEEVSGTEIPEQNGQGDFACFFSVFTHLLHEQTYLYLKEAKRVLRPGGTIVFSFLEFPVDIHWRVFLDTVYRESIGAGSGVLNVFINRNDIPLWASSLEMSIIDIRGGDEAFISLPEPVTMDDGEVKFGPVAMGQSVCVLSV